MIFPSLKIKNKIYTLSILAGIFFIIITIITFQSLQKLDNDFNEYTKINKNAKNYINMTNEVEKLKKHVQEFTDTGYKNAAKKAKDVYKNILPLLENNESLNYEKLNENVKSIKFHLDRFYQNFLKVEKQRSKRDKQRIQIRDYANLVEKELKEIINITEDTNKRIKIFKLHIKILESEKSAFKYFDSLNNKYVLNSKKSLKNIKNDIDLYIKIEKNQLIKIRLIKARQYLEKYSNIFLKSVQHTKGYLSLTNVVMAAEAYEIIFHAERISIQAQKTMDNIQNDFDEKISQNNKELILVFLLFFVIMIITSIYITKSIIKPIRILSQTFNSLSKGNLNINIPEYTLKDEISELSEAAATFQNKNIQTVNLLEKADKLTAELLNKDEQLNVATQSAQIGIWNYNLKEKKLIIDEIMHSLYGIKNDINSISDYNNWKECIHPQDKDNVISLFKGFLENNEKFDTKFKIIKKGTKEIRYIKAYAVLTKDKEGSVSHIIGVNYDITDFELLTNKLEKRVEEEVYKQREQEQALIQQSKLASMGEMISAISHQWRQPLNAVAIYLQDLISAQKHGELDVTYLKESVTKCREQINYMSNTIEDFRNFFNPVSNNEDMNLKEIIKISVNLFEAQLKNNSVKVNFNFDEKTDYTLFGNSNHLKQALANLLSNSIYSIKDRESKDLDKEYRGNIIIHLNKTSKAMIIEVIDNGIGIKKSSFNRVFEPYFTTKKQGEGSGIGLYMTRTILEKYFNGKISLEALEEGVSAKIELPINK